MNIENLTIKDAKNKIEEYKEILKVFNLKDDVSKNDEDHNFEIGKNILIRTVTHIQIGKLEWVGKQELGLSSASWIADTGRFQDSLENGVESCTSSEIELFPKNRIVSVGRGAIIDSVRYDHDLPSSQK